METETTSQENALCELFDMFCLVVEVHGEARLEHWCREGICVCEFQVQANAQKTGSPNEEKARRGYDNLILTMQQPCSSCLSEVKLRGVFSCVSDRHALACLSPVAHSFVIKSMQLSLLIRSNC